MISRRLLWLIVIVSVAHGMAHVFELSLPSVEQEIAASYDVDEDNKIISGWLSACWRLPWGLGALGAGWLVDRYGSRRLLAVYLLGCAATCLLAAIVQPLNMLFVVMFMMGLFASIYHPAGLSLISHETTEENRPRALGLHGIFGSAGIGSAPLLAGLTLHATGSWRAHYGTLAIIAVTMGIVFLVLDMQHRAPQQPHQKPPQPLDPKADHADWPAYFILTSLALLQGITYSAALSFLPRYIDNSGIGLFGMEREVVKNILTAGVLLVGCVGQFLAGRYARSERLEIQLACVMFLTVPTLVAMTFVSGWTRVWVVGAFALIHFMHQPIYNSLIAKYTSRRRRSLAYGFSFAMGLGIGGLGALLMGYCQSDLIAYGILALLETGAGALAIVLWRRVGVRLEA